MTRRLASLAALLLPTLALAGAPHLVRDVNTTPIPGNSIPSDFHDQGSWSMFVASDGVHPAEPWGTDGTSAGTLRLGAVHPLPPGVTGYTPVQAGALTYFFTNGSNGASALWRTDGTAAGTQLVLDVGSSGTNPSGVVGSLDGKLVFTVYQTVSQTGGGRELWISDGTAAGTHLIKDVNGANSGAVSTIIANNKIYFFADAGNSQMEPWVSDGTEAGTHRIAQIPNIAPENISYPSFIQVGRDLLFDVRTSTAGKELWRIELDNYDAVSQVLDIAPGTTSSIQSPQFGSVGSIALFFASSTGGAPALWRSDGTPGGTAFLANVSALSSFPTFMGPTAAGQLVFIGNDGSGTAHVWASDGITATALNATDSALLAQIGANVYFSTNTGSGMAELWRTDGTPAGTHKLTGLPANMASLEVAGGGSQLFVRTSSLGGAFAVYRYDIATDTATLLRSYSVAQGEGYPSVFAFAQNRLYFNSTDAVTGRELWTSDGTAAGTHILRNLAPETRTPPSSPMHLFEFGGKLYFSADDGVAGRELWRSDGTSAGTQLVKDLNSGTASSDPITMFELGGRLYFFAKDGANADSYKLWSSDGTQTGTTVVSAVVPREALYGGTTPCGTSVVTLNGRAYFSAYDTTWGTELWRTDGTPGGTERVSDLSAGSVSADPCWLTQFQNRIVFNANSFGTTGNELFGTQASVNAPTLIADINPGTASSAPREIQTFNNALYFFAAGDSAIGQLWTSDGSSAGTHAVSSFVSGNGLQGLTPAGSKLVFIAGVGAYGGLLCASDGTTAGTGQIGNLRGIGPLYSDGTRVFYTGSDMPLGGLYISPWVTDGTEAGTHLLVNTGGTALMTIPIFFWDFRGLTMFQAMDGDGHINLWRSDGTSAGTANLGAVGATASSSLYPVTHKAAGQTFFFVADDGTTGAELYAIDNDPPIAGDDAVGSVEAGKSLTINLLANDSDADGQVKASTVQVLTSAAGGTVSVDSTGVATYTANASFSGADQFTYSVADVQGARSLPATVRLTVTAAAPPTTPPTTPPTVPPSTQTGGGGGALGGFELLALLLVLTLARADRRASVRGFMDVVDSAGAVPKRLLEGLRLERKT